VRSTCASVLPAEDSQSLLPAEVLSAERVSSALLRAGRHAFHLRVLIFRY